jgi:transposase
MLLERQGALTETSDDDRVATEADDEQLNTEIDEANAAKSPPTGRKPRRRRLPRSLRREVIHHELGPDERACTCCGEPMAKIGEDVSEVLERVPAHFLVHEHHRAKYACSRCKETVKTAPAPRKLVEKGMAGASVLAHVVQSKYGDHVPLSRLQAMYARDGVELATSTLTGFVGQVADAVAPVAERIREKALSSHTLQIDASGLAVLDRDDPNGIRKGTMWCMVGDKKTVSFTYAASGSGEDGPWRLLAEREGYVQADGANVFDRIFNGKVATAEEVGCWAHGRRRLHALRESDPRVAYPLKLIAQLYRVETLADARDASPEERRALRLARSSPILKRLDRWLVRTASKEPPESALHKACAYVINQWEALITFLDDGRLALDNNLCEQQIRSLALGRKNYLFAGAEVGAERAAVLYSLLRTAALAGVNPLAYLTQVIERIADGWPMSRIDELLPQNYSPACTDLAESVPVD